MTELTILTELTEMTAFIYHEIKFPDCEKFGLQSQIRRAMISVSLNIREGNVYRDKKKLQFFTIAKASLEEVDQCFILTQRLYLIPINKIDKYKIHYNKCYNMLNKLIRNLKKCMEVN